MAKTLEQQLAILDKRLLKVEKSIDKKIQLLMRTNETSNVFYSSLQKQILKDYKEAELIYKKWNELAIPKQYNKNIAAQIRKVKSRKYFKPNIKLNTKKFLNKDVNKQTIASIIAESTATYVTALDAGRKDVFRLIHTTKQTKIAEKRINQLVSEGVFEKGSSYGAKKNLLKEFEKVVDGGYIKIIDKNGNPRRYKLKTYADLVARTKMAEAQSLGTMNTALAYGTDLIQVSSHNTTTPICLPYEGKIFSLTGATKDFPIIDVLTPFHPNCLHRITVVFAEALKINGTYNDYVKFSNGKTHMHPTQSSFIPNNNIKARVKNQNMSVVNHYNRTHKKTKMTPLTDKQINNKANKIKEQMKKVA